MWVLSAIAVSLAGIAWLSDQDAKRRRAFRRPPPETRVDRRLLWAAVLLPGVALLLFASGVSATLWAGALLVGGWLIVLPPPGAFKSILRLVTFRR